MVPNQRQNPSSAMSGGMGFEIAIAVIGAVVFTAVGVVYAGAWLAVRFTGGHVSGGLTELLAVVGRLAKRPGEPTAAWGASASGLPSAAVYWTCTALVLIVAVGMAAAAVWLVRRSGRPSRERLGVAVEARIARPGDVRPLVVGSSVPPQGRMLLGRLAKRGPMLATEDRERHPLAGRRAGRQGDRGSVALIGPTRSGKTVLAAGGIIAWDGPVIALSVKRDLYDATAAARARRGDIAVFDPSGVTGLPTARWTPLRGDHIDLGGGARRAGIGAGDPDERRVGR